MTSKLLTVHEAAERLALKPATVRRMVSERRIDTIRPSIRAVRIPEESIERILEKGFCPAIM